MKITIIEGHTINPGDLSWSALEALGELTIIIFQKKTSQKPLAVLTRFS